MINSKEVKAVHKGLTEIEKIYHGTNIVFENGVLPSAYQRVGYIEATSKNGAYIDLNTTHDESTAVEIGWIFQGWSQDLQIFGAVESGSRRFCLSAEYAGLTSATKSTTSFYDTTYNGSSYSFRNIPYPIDPSIQIGDEELVKFQVIPNSMTKAINMLDGREIDTETPTIMPAYRMVNNFFLLGQNYNGSYRGKGLKQVTSYKQWDKNGALVRNMVPCYRKSDGEIGMYDLVNRVFYTNAGTGSFGKGADVNE